MIKNIINKIKSWFKTKKQIVITLTAKQQKILKKHKKDKE
jgi:hypothetical protein